MFYANKILGAHPVEHGGGTVLNMTPVQGIAGGTDQSGTPPAREVPYS